MTATNGRPNPYVGPRAFRLGETIYGRDREVAALRNLLLAERVVLLYSPSGAGKTSLVQAALIPALAREGLRALPVVRVNHEPPRDAAGHPAANRYVLSALQALEEPLPPEERTTPGELIGLDLATYLERRPTPPSANGSSPPEILIFDQFEEILTVDPIDRAAKGQFFAQLAVALRDRGRWALFALREDYLAGLDPYRRTLPTQLGNRFRLDLLTPEAAAAAIQEPARAEGVAFHPTAARQLVADLSRVRVEQDGVLAEQPGQYVEPVQLQVVCLRLWAHLTADDREIDETDLAAAGDVDTALSDFYAEQVAAVATATGVAERDIRAWFDEQLITRQRIRGQVLQDQERSQGLTNQAIWALVNAHLVRAEKRRGVTWFELAHDRLVAPVCANNAAWFAANLSPLQRQAKLWDDQGQAVNYLFNREALALAESWLQGYPGQLTEVERSFLERCRERERRRLDELAHRQRELDLVRQRAKDLARARRRLARILAATFLLAVVAWMAAIEAIESGTVNREMVAADLATRLGAEDVPNLLADHQDNVAALVARQAEEVDRRGGGKGGEQVIAALNGALAQDPFAHVLPERLSGPVRAVAFGDNGRLLAFGGDDGRIQLWNVAEHALREPALNGPGGVLSLAFSADGRLLAAGGCRERRLATACQRGYLQVWDLARPDQPWRAPAVDTGEIRGIAFHPTRPLLAWGEPNGAVRVWDLDQPSDGPLEATGQSGGVHAVAFTPDGRLLAAGGCTTRQDDTGACTAGSVRLFDPSQLDPSQPAAARAEFTGPENQVLAVAFSLDGQLLVGGSGKEIWVWDWGRRGGACPGTNGMVSQAQNICSWKLSGHTAPITSVAFDPNDGSLISASYDNTLRFWDPRGPKKLRLAAIASYPDAVITQAVRVADGQVLATGSTDGLVRLWDLRGSGQAPSVLRAHRGEVWGLAFNPDRKRPMLASGALDGSVFLWDRQRPEAEPALLPHPTAATSCGGNEDDGVWSVAFSPDGRLLAAGYGDGSIRVWSVDDRRLLHDPLQDRHCDDVRALSFSRDGRYLASGDWAGKVFVWDIGDLDRPPHPLDTGANDLGVVRALAFSPADASLLAVGGCRQRPPTVGICQSGGTVLLGDWAGSLEQVCCRGDDLNDAVYSLGFSPNGQTLAVGALDGAIQLWSVADRTPHGAPLTGHRFSVRALVFPNDDRLISASDDGTVRRWNLGDLLAVPEILVTHPAPAANCQDASSPDGVNLCPIYAAAVSPDGRTLASGDIAHRIRVSLLDAEPLVDLVCKRVRRDLTNEEWERHLGSETPRERVC